jgi:hypothetical protein
MVLQIKPKKIDFLNYYQNYITKYGVKFIPNLKPYLKQSVF